MQLFRPLDSILGQQSKVKILRYLLRSPAELNGREIARAVGLSHVKCHTALKELAKHGIVVLRTSGRTTLYRLHRDNLFVKEVLRPLFVAEGKTVEKMVRTILRGLSFQPLSLTLFGSHAKQHARPESDVDLLVVVPEDVDIRVARRQVDGVETDVLRFFGNPLAPIVLHTGQLRRRYARGESLIAEILATGRVLYGKSLRELVSGSS